MSTERFSFGKLPPAAVAAVAACLFGYMYCFSFRELLDAQHWFAFSAPVGLTFEDYNTSVTFIAISMFVYYSLYLVTAVLLVLRSRRYMMITLPVMAGVRLVGFVLLFRPGFQMVFQLGFESVLEIVALLCTAYIYKNVGKNKKLYDSRITVCVLAVMAEAIPLLRNFQYLFMPELTLGAKISAIMLPCFTAVFLSFLAFRSAGRKPVFFRNENMEEAMAEASEDEFEDETEESHEAESVEGEASETSDLEPADEPNAEASLLPEDVAEKTDPKP